MASASQAFEGFCRLAGTRKAEFPGTRAVWRDPLEARNWNRRCKTNGGKNANWADGTGPGPSPGRAWEEPPWGRASPPAHLRFLDICVRRRWLFLAVAWSAPDPAGSPTEARPTGHEGLLFLEYGLAGGGRMGTVLAVHVVSPHCRRRGRFPVARITAPFRRAEKCHPLVLGAAGDAGAASWRTRGRCRARCTGAARCVSRTWWSRGGRSGGV